MTDLEKLAWKIRQDCHSGYVWNAPDSWEKLPEIAKMIWLGRAVRGNVQHTEKGQL